MQLRQIFLSLFLLGGFFSAKSQEIAVLEVNSSGRGMPAAIPLSTDLDQLTYLADSALVLVEWVDGQPQPVNFQIEHENGRKLVWMLDQKKKGLRTFKLLERGAAPFAPVRSE